MSYRSWRREWELEFIRNRQWLDDWERENGLTDISWRFRSVLDELRCCRDYYEDMVEARDDLLKENADLREANERLRKRLEDQEDCACWVEYDYRCPVHGEQSE